MKRGKCNGINHNKRSCPRNISEASNIKKSGTTIVSFSYVSIMFNNEMFNNIYSLLLYMILYLFLLLRVQSQSVGSSIPKLTNKKLCKS